MVRWYINYSPTSGDSSRFNVEGESGFVDVFVCILSTSCYVVSGDIVVDGSRWRGFVYGRCCGPGRAHEMSTSGQRWFGRQFVECCARPEHFQQESVKNRYWLKPETVNWGSTWRKKIISRPNLLYVYVRRNNGECNVIISLVIRIMVYLFVNCGRFTCHWKFILWLRILIWNETYVCSISNEIVYRKRPGRRNTFGL